MSFFLPFFPLERRHLRQLFELRLQERSAELQRAKLGGLQWDAAVLDFLLSKVRLRGTEGWGLGCVWWEHATAAACVCLPGLPGRQVATPVSLSRVACRMSQSSYPALLSRPLPVQVDFDGDFPIEGAKEVGTLMTRYVSRPVREWAAAQQQRAEQQKQAAKQLAKQAKQAAKEAKQQQVQQTQHEAKQQEAQPPQQPEALSSGRLRIARSRKELTIEPTQALA